MELVGIGNADVENGKPLAEVKQGFTKFKEGDVLIAKITPCFENGKGTIATNLINGVGFGSTEFHVLRPKESIDNRYLYYVSASYPFRTIGEGEMQGTAGQKRVTESFVSNYVLPVPPVHEQQAIADYLDRETARIDALIAKYQRLLELLDEKRKSFVNQLATNGNNPGTKKIKIDNLFIDSIPENWKVNALKRLVTTKITDGPHETPELLDDGVPIVSAEAIQNDSINFESKRGFISNELHQQFCKKLRPQRDDIFMVKSGATTGKLAIVNTDIEFSVWSPLALIRADDSEILPGFLFNILHADYIQNQVKQLWSQGTQQNISMDEIEKIFVLVPSIPEQKQLVNVIDIYVKEIEIMKSKLHILITRLNEYRVSLVSSAVTGKIEIRSNYSR